MPTNEMFGSPLTDEREGFALSNERLQRIAAEATQDIEDVAVRLRAIMQEELLESIMEAAS